MQLTRNFTLEELTASTIAKKLNLKNIPNEGEIASLRRLCEEVLQPIRDKYGRPIRITSGFRNRSLNQMVNGSATSQHLRGEAADIISSDNKNLWNLICGMISNGEITVGQLIDEKKLQWIHISLPTDRHKNHILHL